MRLLALLVVLVPAVARAQVTTAVARDLGKGGEAIDPGARFPESVPRLFVAFDAPAPLPGVTVRWRDPAGHATCEVKIMIVAGRSGVPCAAVFEPGEWRVEVLGPGGAALADLPITIEPGGPPAPPAPLASDLEGRTDLAAARSGGRVRLASSEANPTDWSSVRLIETPRKGKGWLAAGAGPQELVFSFRDDLEARVDGVVLDPRTGDRDLPAALPRVVEVWVSSTAPTSGMTRVAAARLPREGGARLIAFPPTAARFVSLRVLATWGQPARLGKVSVLEAPGASVLAGLPPPAELPDDVPRARPIDPAIVAQLPSAAPIAPEGATDVALKNGKALARFEVKEAGVVHVGVLNVLGAVLRVYDADGEALVAVRAGGAGYSAWHGALGPGAYFAHVSAAGAQRARPSDDTPEARAAFTPAIVVLHDPVPPRRTPFQAAQLGLDYLEVEAASWQSAHQCIGCHVQSQTLLGMAVAQRNGYHVEPRVANALGELLVTTPSRNDDDLQLFRQLGLSSYADTFAPARVPAAAGLAAELAAKAPPGFLFPGRVKRPIQQGAITQTAMAIEVLAPRGQAYAALVAGAAAALRAQDARTVQDRSLRILALLAAGQPVVDDAAALLALQNGDGGWGERDGGGASNAYGTGQALHALKRAGLSPGDRRFARGVEWLMTRQGWSGAWPLVATDAATEMAHTMWAVLGLAGSYDPGGAVAPPQPLDVLLVPVRVTAADAAGRTLNDLGPADFVVREDGVEQPVVRVTRETGDFTIVLVIDTSGSIRAALPTMISAATGFVRLLRPKDRVALVSFGDAPAPPEPFATDRPALIGKLGALTARGGTALYDAVGVALDRLAPEPGPRAIVLITDGKDENDRGTGPGSRARLAGTLERLGAADAPLYAIGLGAGVEKKVLSQLAGASGGRAYFVNMPRELPRLYADLAGALRSQYVVVYRSSRPADGKWRKIDVDVKRPGARVDATPGFPGR